MLLRNRLCLPDGIWQCPPANAKCHQRWNILLWSRYWWNLISTGGKKKITSHISTTTMLMRNILMIMMAMCNIVETIRSMSMTSAQLIRNILTDAMGKKGAGCETWWYLWFSFWQVKKQPARRKTSKMRFKPRKILALIEPPPSKLTPKSICSWY